MACARDARSVAHARCTSTKKLKKSHQPKFRKAVDEAKAAAVAAEAAAARAAIAAVAQAERKGSLRAERAVRVLDVVADEPAPRKRARDSAGGGATSACDAEAAEAEAAEAMSTEHKCVRLKPPAQHRTEAMGEASAEASASAEAAAASQREAIGPGPTERRGKGVDNKARERRSQIVEELRAFVRDRYKVGDEVVDGWDVEIIRRS